MHSSTPKVLLSLMEKACILAVLRKTFSIGKKSNFKFQNRWEKIKIPPGRRHFFEHPEQKSHQVAGTFFETTSEAKCPRLVLHVLC